MSKINMRDNGLGSFAGFMSMLHNTDVVKKDKKEETTEKHEPNVKIIKATNRPTSFKEYINESNEQAVKVLRDTVKACQIKNKAMPHILLFGPAGTGKTTLSKICAYEFGNAEFIETIGSALKKSEEILSILLKVWEYQMNGSKVILFIDEVHELGKSRVPDTLWYTILEDFTLYHTLEGETFDGIYLESNIFEVEPFTIIGATTDPALMKKPLRDRFRLHCVLKPYSNKDIYKVVGLSAKKRKYKITPKAMDTIANRSRGNPRISINFLEASENKRIVKRKKLIDKDIVSSIFSDLRIEDNCLKENDIKILR